jgi:hypothetical protein
MASILLRHEAALAGDDAPDLLIQLLYGAEDDLYGSLDVGRQLWRAVVLSKPLVCLHRVPPLLPSISTVLGRRVHKACQTLARRQLSTSPELTPAMTTSFVVARSMPLGSHVGGVTCSVFNKPARQIRGPNAAVSQWMTTRT